MLHRPCAATCSNRREIAVPWKDPFAVVELGLRSMLSMDDVVETLLHIFGEQTTCSLSPAARGGNLAKIPPNQVIDDFGRGSSVESES